MTGTSFDLVRTRRSGPPAAPSSSVAPEEAEGVCAIAGGVVTIVVGQKLPSPQDRRSRASAFARQVAMYLAHVGFGLSMAEVGKAFGRDRTTVVHACHLIEDRRDERRFDDLLDHLEQAAVALRAAARINRQT